MFNSNDAYKYKLAINLLYKINDKICKFITAYYFGEGRVNCIFAYPVAKFVHTYALYQ